VDINQGNEPSITNRKEGKKGNTPNTQKNFPPGGKGPPPPGGRDAKGESSKPRENNASIGVSRKNFWAYTRVEKKKSGGENPFDPVGNHVPWERGRGIVSERGGGSLGGGKNTVFVLIQKKETPVDKLNWGKKWRKKRRLFITPGRGRATSGKKKTPPCREKLGKGRRGRYFSTTEPTRHSGGEGVAAWEGISPAKIH